MIKNNQLKNKPGLTVCKNTPVNNCDNKCIIPTVTNETMADRYKKAYTVLLAKQPNWKRDEIINNPTSRWNDKFSQQVASLAESSNNLQEA